MEHATPRQGTTSADAKEQRGSSLDVIRPAFARWLHDPTVPVAAKQAAARQRALTGPTADQWRRYYAATATAEVIR